MTTPAPRPARAFTLVELLVVISIIALLIGVLLPALGRARDSARTVRCLTNLRAIAQAMVTYTVDHRGRIVPAYNLPPATPTAATNYTGGPAQPLDGWACLLDRDGYCRGPAVFACPDAIDQPGLANGATGVAGANPRGHVDWPLAFLGNGDTAPKLTVTIPSAGLNHTLRVSYWINAYHPTGQTLVPDQVAQRDLYYSTVVGYGGDAEHRLPARRTAQLRQASRTITVADGVFLGRQSADDYGMSNSLVGYRHRGPAGPLTAANAAFADGHAETLPKGRFPCALAPTATYAAAGGSTTLARQRAINANGPTVYADPAAALDAFARANPSVN